MRRETPSGQQTDARHAAPPLAAPSPVASSPAPAAPHARPAPTWLILVVFFLFAGLISETFLTNSTAPLHILRNPLSVVYNILLYGTADVLAREIIVRRRAGLASTVLLGAAFGLVNEGVVAGTWYFVRPEGYAFVGGIDWTWVVSLTLFHTVFSVITPIAFIELLFPAIRGLPLLRRRGIAVCVVVFFACVGVVFFVIAAFKLPIPLFLPYRLSVLAVAILCSLVALALPPGAPRAAPSARPLPGMWQLRIMAFLAMVAYFVLANPVPALVARLLRSLPGGIVMAQGIDCAVLLAFGALLVWRGWSWSRRAGWSPRQNLALLLGAATFTTLLLNLTEPAMGEPFATLPFYALLIALTLRWRRRAPAPPAAV